MTKAVYISPDGAVEEVAVQYVTSSGRTAISGGRIVPMETVVPTDTYADFDREVARTAAPASLPAVDALDEVAAGLSDAECTAFEDLIEKAELAVAGLGIAGEAGEVADLLKKHVGHGHELDREKLKKELGDVLWCVSRIAQRFGFGLEDVARANVAKLRQRYPNGFSTEASKRRADVAQPVPVVDREGLAQLIAAARAAERERCAGMVREMAESVGESLRMCRDGGNPYAPRSDYDVEREARADVLEDVASDLRDLAERIGKGRREQAAEVVEVGAGGGDGCDGGCVLARVIPQERGAACVGARRPPRRPGRRAAPQRVREVTREDAERFEAARAEARRKFYELHQCSTANSVDLTFSALRAAGLCVAVPDTEWAALVAERDQP